MDIDVASRGVRVIDFLCRWVAEYSPPSRDPPHSLAGQDEQWRTLGDAVQAWFRDAGPAATVWVSTEGSGAGVHWLCMRLDSRPKYYRHAPYRQPNYGLALSP